MFQTHVLNNKIDKLHERFLCVIYMDRKFSFEDLVKNGRPISIHPKSVHAVEIEMSKVVNGSPPKIVNQKIPFTEENSLQP